MLCWPLESVRSVVRLAVQQLDVHCDTKTKDNVFVKIQVAVLYKVVPEKAVNAYYKLTDHKAQITYV